MTLESGRQVMPPPATATIYAAIYVVCVKYVFAAYAQDDETVFCKTHVARGTTFEIQDFGENYSIERTREHQAYYFGEVGASIYGCMLRICVEDLSDTYLGPDEKARLLELFASVGKAPIVLIAHIIISEDLCHDNAFVQHVNGNIIWPWIKSVIAPGVIIRLRTLCTDGAPSVLCCRIARYHRSGGNRAAAGR